MGAPATRQMQALNREIQAADEKMEELLVGTTELEEMQAARMAKKGFKEGAQARICNQ